MRMLCAPAKELRGRLYVFCKPRAGICNVSTCPNVDDIIAPMMEAYDLPYLFLIALRRAPSSDSCSGRLFLNLLSVMKGVCGFEVRVFNLLRWELHIDDFVLHMISLVNGDTVR